MFYSQEERGACDSPLFSCVTLSPGLATIVFCPSFHSGFPSFFTHCGGFRCFPRFHQVFNSSYPCFAMCLRYQAKKRRFFIALLVSIIQQVQNGLPCLPCQRSRVVLSTAGCLIQRPHPKMHVSIIWLFLVMKSSSWMIF